MEADLAPAICPMVHSILPSSLTLLRSSGSSTSTIKNCQQKCQRRLDTENYCQHKKTEADLQLLLDLEGILHLELGHELGVFLVFLTARHATSALYMAERECREVRIEPATLCAQA